MPRMLDGECLAHTLDHIGEHFDTPVLKEFMNAVTFGWSTSPASKAVWKDLMGTSPVGESDTRWWSWWEVVVDIMPKFGSLPSYVASLKVSTVQIWRAPPRPHQ